MAAKNASGFGKTLSWPFSTSPSVQSAVQGIVCAERNPLDMVQGTESIAQSEVDSEYQVETPILGKRHGVAPLVTDSFPR